MRLAFRGVETGEGVPEWAVILRMANGDPLRAQQIAEELTPEWWAYACAYWDEAGKAREQAESG